MDKATIGCGGCSIVLAIIAIATLITGAIVFLLFNLLIAPVFGIAAISYWQAVGLGFALTVIGNIFFKSSSK